MAGGHHGSFAGRFFQVAGFGAAGAGAGLGVPPLGGWDAAPPEGGTPCGTLAVERAPSPPGAEGWVEGEGGAVLADAGALEPSGFSPSPRPGSAGRGGDAGSVWAEAAFTLSARAETTALAGTVTAMVGAWSLTSSRGMKMVAPESAMFGGSLAGRSGAAEVAELPLGTVGFVFGMAGDAFEPLGFSPETVGNLFTAVEEAFAAEEFAIAVVGKAFEAGGKGFAAVDKAFAPVGWAPAAAVDGLPTVEYTSPAVAIVFSPVSCLTFCATCPIWCASDACPVGPFGTLAIPDGFSAGADAFPAAAGGLATASDGLGAAPLPSSGLSALDLRNQSSMSAGGGE